MDIQQSWAKRNGWVRFHSIDRRSPKLGPYLERALSSAWLRLSNERILLLFSYKHVLSDSMLFSMTEHTIISIRSMALTMVSIGWLAETTWWWSSFCFSRGEWGQWLSNMVIPFAKILLCSTLVISSIPRTRETAFQQHFENALFFCCSLPIRREKGNPLQEESIRINALYPMRTWTLTLSDDQYLCNGLLTRLLVNLS